MDWQSKIDRRVESGYGLIVGDQLRLENKPEGYIVEVLVVGFDSINIPFIKYLKVNYNRKPHDKDDAINRYEVGYVGPLLGWTDPAQYKILPKMNSTLKSIEYLSCLYLLNSARIGIHENLAETLESTEIMFKTLLYQLAEESQELRKELSDRILAVTGDVPQIENNIEYLKWDKRISDFAWEINLEKENSHAKRDVVSVSARCVEIEKLTTAVYTAIKEYPDFQELPASARHLITDQSNMLRMSHDMVISRNKEYNPQ